MESNNNAIMIATDWHRISCFA